VFTVQLVNTYILPDTLDIMIVAELLHAKGAGAEPHTIENLVTHQSKKFWSSRNCLYTRLYVHQYAKLNTLKNNRVALPLP